LQTVAPDPIVSRPLRPEPSARTRGNDQGGAFDAMLDAKPIETPPRPDRAPRADRRNDLAPKGRPEARAEHASDTRLQHAAEPATSADSAPPGQAKNGQPSHTDERVLADPQAEGDAVQTEAAAQVAAALDAIVVETDGKAPTTGETETPAVTVEPAAKDSDEASVPVADAKPAEIAPIVVAAALPVQAAPAPMIEPTADADVAPVAAAPAPVAPADPARAEAPAVAAPVAADGKDKTPKSAIPKEAEADTQAAASDTPRPAAPKELVAAEPKQPDQKTEADKPKSGQPSDRPSGQQTADPRGAIKPTAPEAHIANARPATEPAADPQAKPAHQPHAPSAEPAAPRTISSEARADAPALPPVAAPSLGMPNNAPIMPFGLALSSSLTATLPHAALRVETADIPVPLAGVAVEIVSRAQDGVKRFDIRLDPPELGRIDVRLDVDHGGKVTSRLIVERAETLDLLRRDAPQLERALQQAGLNTEGGMQFSLRDQNFGRDQARDNAATSHLIVPEDDTAATEAARRGYGRLIGLGGGIDIRV
jgi:hypothetical protein